MSLEVSVDFTVRKDEAWIQQTVSTYINAPRAWHDFPPVEAKCLVSAYCGLVSGF